MKPTPAAVLNYWADYWDEWASITSDWNEDKQSELIIPHIQGFPTVTATICDDGVVVTATPPYTATGPTIRVRDHAVPVALEVAHLTGGLIILHDESDGPLGPAESIEYTRQVTPAFHPVTHRPFQQRNDLNGHTIWFGTKCPSGEWSWDLMHARLGTPEGWLRFEFDDLAIRTFDSLWREDPRRTARQIATLVVRNKDLPKRDRLPESELLASPGSAAEKLLQRFRTIRERFEDLLRTCRHETELTAYLDQYPFLVVPRSTRHAKELDLRNERRADLGFDMPVPPHVLLVELERPDVQLMTQAGDHANAVVKAERQIVQWQQILKEDYATIVDHLKGLGFVHTDEIRYWIVIGRRDELLGPGIASTDASRAGWVRTRSFFGRSGLELMTYDDLLDGARASERELASVAAASDQTL